MVQVLDGPQGSNTISIMESSEASDNDEKQFLMPNIIPDRKGLVTAKKSRENRRKLGKTLLPPKQRGKLGQAIFFTSFYSIICLFQCCLMLGRKFPSFP